MDIRVRERLTEAGFDPDPGLAAFHRTYQACLSVPDSKRTGSDDWLLRAAEIGNTLAMREVARRNGESYEGYQWLERAWQAGDADALPELERAYANGWASVDSSPDPLMAYAYGYLVNTLWRPPTKSRPGYPAAGLP